MKKRIANLFRSGSNVQMAPAIARIRAHLTRLENPETSNGHRLMLWRAIRGAALDAHDYELHQLESLNVVHADPALTAAHGEPVV